jgi:hypothetical protein
MAVNHWHFLIVFWCVLKADGIEHVTVPVVERQPSEASNGETANHHGLHTSAEAAQGVDKHFTMLNGKLDVRKP